MRLSPHAWESSYAMAAGLMPRWDFQVVGMTALPERCFFSPRRAVPRLRASSPRAGDGGGTTVEMPGGCSLHVRVSSSAPPPLSPSLSQGRKRSANFNVVHQCGPETL